MDGTEGPSSQSAKDLAKNLSKDITENITLWDERLSSQGAFNLIFIKNLYYFFKKLRIFIFN